MALICDLTAINGCAIKNKLTIRKPYDDRDSQIDLNVFRPALGASREQVKARYELGPLGEDLGDSCCVFSEGMVLADSQVPLASASKNVCFSASSVCMGREPLILQAPGMSVPRKAPSPHRPVVAM